MRTRLLVLFAVCLQLFVAPWQPRAHAAASADDQRMVGVVAARIFAQAAPIPGWAWPPKVAISDRDDVNAFATIYNVKPGETPDVKDEGNLTWVTLPEYDAVPAEEALSAANLHEAAEGGGDPVQTTSVKAPEGAADGPVENADGTVTQPIIVLYQGFLDKVVMGNPDRLAAVFGHETSHILLRHVDAAGIGATLVANMISRQHESDSDMLGMKLGLKANFPYKGLVSGILGMREQGNYNSFEGLNATHPGWTDRVAMIDDKQTELWQSISAFENGVEFLTIEQYALATDCFQQVVNECPKCYEAYANLGYAQLMRYCDALREEDLRFLDVGQLVVGGFYHRPASMEGPLGRGPGNRKLWLEAVGNLRQAIILNPDLVLVKANLAVAFLVAPDGKDVGQAEELFMQVREALASGKVEEMPPLVRAALLVNAGVAEMETGDPDGAEKLFAQAQSVYTAAAEADREDDDDTDDDDEDNRNSGEALASAIRYNRGRMVASTTDPEKRQTGIVELEAYLTSSSPAANWWPLAYENYAKLCADAGVEPKAEKDMQLEANTVYRKVTGIAIPDGPTITLNDSPDSLAEVLGEGHAQVVVKGSDVRRLQYYKLGMEILCDQHIVAIRLRGAKAPAVVLQAAGLGGEKVEVKNGMTTEDLDAMLGGDADQWDQRYGTNTQVVYRFYTRLGFGVRLSGNKITEIIVAQIPVEAKLK